MSDINVRKYGYLIVGIICLLLVAASFFATNFVFFDYKMKVPDYNFVRAQISKPSSAVTSIWFSFDDSGKNLRYATDDITSDKDLTVYSLTKSGEVEVTNANVSPINENSLGHLIAALPVRETDLDKDGQIERIYDYTRADFGENSFNPIPQHFNSKALPFELVFSERKFVLVYFQNEILRNAQITLTTHDGKEILTSTNENGWIEGLSNKDIREGFSASFSPDGTNVYRMSYYLEGYPYFSPYFFKAHLVLLEILALTVLGILLIFIFRKKFEKGDIYSRERISLFSNVLDKKPASKFIIFRWSCLFLGMFYFTYFGKLIGRGQVLNEVSLPVFSCPYNLDQITESPCYYLSHLPELFNRFGASFPARNLFYGTVFLFTTILSFILFGRILCGFLCPAGLLQDLMDKLRRVLHIRPVIVTDKINKVIQPIKWVWIILFLSFTFSGGDFCNICPVKPFSTAQGGFWTNLYLGGFLAVFILVGSFFIKRFWCLMCPMGYLMGLLKRFNLIKLKKDCTACTECGACYNACPMRIKSIYTEREDSFVQTVDCLMCGECIDKCPEDNALSFKLMDMAVYTSSRKSFMNKYSRRNSDKIPKQMRRIRSEKGKEYERV